MIAGDGLYGLDPLDLMLEEDGLHGLEVLARIRDLHPELPVIITGYGTVETVVVAMKRGASESVYTP